MMIVMWFSRYREFRADKSGAALVRRGKMVVALRRLQWAHEPQPLPDEMSAFGIAAARSLPCSPAVHRWRDG